MRSSNSMNLNVLQVVKFPIHFYNVFG